MNVHHFGLSSIVGRFDGGHWSNRLKSLAASAALFVACAASAQAPPLVARMVSAEGVINGKAVRIESVVAAPAGTNDQKLSALATTSARKLGADVADGFSTLDGVFPQFFDKKGKNNAITVSYNPTGASAPGTQAALEAALATWSSVKGSTFRFSYGGVTSRQLTFGDGFNDVGWLSGTEDCNQGCVLAQTISPVDYRTAALLEFDIVIYAYPWTLEYQPAQRGQPGLRRADRAPARAWPRCRHRSHHR